MKRHMHTNTHANTFDFTLNPKIRIRWTNTHRKITVHIFNGKQNPISISSMKWIPFKIHEYSNRVGIKIRLCKCSLGYYSSVGCWYILIDYCRVKRYDKHSPRPMHYTSISHIDIRHQSYTYKIHRWDGIWDQLWKWF